MPGPAIPANVGPDPEISFVLGEGGGRERRERARAAGGGSG